MHIYVVSTVFKQKAPTWERLLKSMEEKRDFMFHGYRPLREALVAEMDEEGAGTAVLDAAFAGPPKSKQDSTIRTKSRSALKVFREKFRPQLGNCLQSFVENGKQENPVRWENHWLTGGFHFSAEGPEDEPVYIYAYCSEWPESQQDGFLELLAICAEKRYEADRKKVWFLDLTNGKTIHPAKSYKNTRKELIQTLDHLSRLRKAIDMGNDA
ncbi:MAG: hypothetical protein SFY68_09155 [Candidatus Sumerlaeia bacterium]|nr:hypothetical protein [Candidatus Sumerlaeia bacterium]